MVLFFQPVLQNINSCIHFPRLVQVVLRPDEIHGVRVKLENSLIRQRFHSVCFSILSNLHPNRRLNRNWIAELVIADKCLKLTWMTTLVAERLGWNVKTAGSILDTSFFFCMFLSGCFVIMSANLFAWRFFITDWSKKEVFKKLFFMFFTS